MCRYKLWLFRDDLKAARLLAGRDRKDTRVPDVYKHLQNFIRSSQTVKCSLQSSCNPPPPNWKTFSEAVQWIVIGSFLSLHHCVTTPAHPSIFNQQNTKIIQRKHLGHGSM